MDAIAGAGTFSRPPAAKNHYDEHLCAVPHPEDEIYVVTTGRPWFTGGAYGLVPVGPGSVLYVPAGETHRFVDIEEDLAMLVVFASPPGSAHPS